MALNNINNDKINKRDLFRQQQDARRKRFEDEPAEPEELPLTFDSPQTGALMQGVTQSAGLTGGNQTNSGLKKSKLTDAQTARQDQNKTNSSQVADQKSPERTNGNQQNKTSGQKLPQKQGIKDRLNQRLDGMIDKNLKKSDQQPVAGRYRDQKRDLKNQQDKTRLRDFKKNQKEGIKQAIAKPARAGSGHLLRLAWLNLIDSFFLTWLYIAFHFVMAYFTPLSGLFCKFGEEWLPEKIKKVGGDAAKIAAKPLELIEILGCLFIGLIITFIISLILIIIISIGWIATNPAEFVKTVFGESVKSVWETVKTVTEWVWK